ncbi:MULTISPECIES: OmpH family outer membrane protein [Aminobacterium]|jgi:outer membrane protein|uniref:Outer membrane chaperone Skp (OmpH) n=1 Tax=Aminobacterium colombiense (strain DSM 12261 / ALA-1) TaxID=572547 RepID=D5EE22_AMICL|nr:MULTISPECIES: OmpH family outer membrane protein [Aminobacterium]MDD2378658.1 OmpH family outer membrane protein [Aminobacterium colombiense]ADE56804.1 outer membrane chaperone Skp (OmpH) [Aminobacterium colombiense DSM 12261]MDD3767676.1 OmpH family outer membrane protein [Aminobacterium colombiense]MDD4264960.1 OmpH family outer membrane protein [Aminobacterium colombiense]MDD4585477.1 OmpH family outer membrane protein [Aminobacterium colombiense]
MIVSKKLVFIVSLAVLAVVMVAGCSMAEEKIGVIDSQKIVFQHPKFESVTQQLKVISQTKENEMKAAVDKETDQNKKMEIYQTKRRELATEEQRLMEPLFKESQIAVRTVAKVKGITVVIEKSAVYFGGIDITDDVIQELKKTAATK